MECSYKVIRRAAYGTLQVIKGAQSSVFRTIFYSKGLKHFGAQIKENLKASFLEPKPLHVDTTLIVSQSYISLVLYLPTRRISLPVDSFFLDDFCKFYMFVTCFYRKTKVVIVQYYFSPFCSS